MPSRHYSKFQKAADQSANAWPARRSVTTLAADEHDRYDAAAIRLKNDIAKILPIGIGSEAVRNPAEIGLRVLFRTCYVAAVVARSNDIRSTEQAGQLMRANDTFEVLDTILTTPDPFATFIRERIGLAAGYALETDEQAYWKLSDSGIGVPTMKNLVDESKKAHTWPYEDAMCGAHRAKIMRPLFNAAITICERDENLFTRSLS